MSWGRPARLAHHPGRRAPGWAASQGFTFSGPGEIFEELRRASAGGIADYSGITYEKIEQNLGVFWPCPAEDHPGTPRLFEEGSWNPIARGQGPFLLPRRQGAFLVAPYSPPGGGRR